MISPVKQRNLYLCKKENRAVPPDLYREHTLLFVFDTLGCFLILSNYDVICKEISYPCFL